MTTQSEQALEQGLIKTLVSMNYQKIEIADENAMVANFRSQLNKHNNTELTDDEFNRIMIHLENGSIFAKAEKLRNRFPLTRDDESVKWIEFLNTQEWCKNEFQVSNQITDEGRRKCRYDVTILVNGLPLVQVELKKRGIELKQAYSQVQRYHKTAFKGLFNYIQIFVISNGVNTRYFANNPNQGYKFTFPWADFKNNHIDRLDIFAAMFFEQCTLGKMLAKYVVLHQSDKCLMILRPYQFYAVEALLDKVANSVKNGYIWHTTGSGKTLTSFKAAQLIAEMSDIDKVLFVVDRHDLDTQTKKEYDAFAPGAVDSTDNTKELVKALQGKKKLMITTIQKLNHAVQKDRYSKSLQGVKDKNIVMIFDECHRSQFGDMHSNITGFFSKIRYFGFTGTPIFADNANNGRTTKDIFGERLHEYLIKDAIADENVLGFLVEYHGKWKRKNENDKQVKSIDTAEVLLKDERIASIADFILSNYNSSTYERDFNAMFAVGGVKMLIKYYDMFKSRNHDLKIATIFTYTQNEESEDEFTGLGQGFASTQNTRDILERYIKDYNETFGTDFDTDHFGLYYDDINKRMKNRQIDLLIVSDMFLTGFDAKKLNTLYVDKNLNYHGLLQAFSRTNRVLNEKKKFGKITCFRDLKQQTDDAIKLYSNNKSSEVVLMKPYEKLVERFNEMAAEFLSHFPTIKSVGGLDSELDKRRFVILFRAMLRLRNEVKGYNEFDAEDLTIEEQRFADYQSKYLDMSNEFAITSEKEDAESILQDIDFELELVHRDIINVMYILSLLQDLKPESSSYPKDRKAVLDTMDSDPDLRSKIVLIDNFIRLHIDGRQSDDLPADMEGDLDKYIATQKAIAIEQVAVDEGIDSSLLHEYVSEYEYLGKPKNEIIKRAIDPLKLSFMDAQTKKKSLIDKMKDIIKLFSWN
ncbi:Type I restriction-modification system, subunit R [Mucinivorans hirudinis]|uniref:Type I restriction enzyme endonuclease subunit n=1 Tax=Mucinivorans hirudinis TaxID=1433126 RepID=A0A060R8K9_9BACT|nr:Type I restriction-modification system, subunit R [Mucinivorans hirudinis]